MNVAFYAPMKSPNHAHPSGDRTMARLLMSALGKAKIDVRIASEMRTWSRQPRTETFSNLMAQSRREQDQLVQRYRKAPRTWTPDIWFTYHNYYRAPDLLGPAIAAQLDIPYVLAEASYASRREGTEWASWLEAAAAGIRKADAVFSFTGRDRAGLHGLVPNHKLHDIRPFLDLPDTPPVAIAAPTSRVGSSPLRLVTVAMMRTGAKQKSYQLLADSLTDLADLNWCLDIIGDGEARAAIETAFGHQNSDRITWHGQLDVSAIKDVLHQSNVFVWPGIEEAFGMAYLEAQANGVPVVACRTAGVPAVVSHGDGGLLAETTERLDFARSMRCILENHNLRAQLTRNSRPYVETHHSIEAASIQLATVFTQLMSAP